MSFIIGETMDMEGEAQDHEVVQRGHIYGERDHHHEEEVIVEMAEMAEQQASVIYALQLKNQRLREQRRQDIELVKGLGEVIKDELRFMDCKVCKVKEQDVLIEPLGTRRQWCCVGGVAGFIAGALVLWMVNTIVYGY